VLHSFSVAFRPTRNNEITTFYVRRTSEARLIRPVLDKIIPMLLQALFCHILGEVEHSISNLDEIQTHPRADWLYEYLHLTFSNPI